MQSAIARHVLTEMLTQLGIVPSLSDVENVFNDGTCETPDLFDTSLGEQRGHLESVLRSYIGAKGRLREDRQTGYPGNGKWITAPIAVILILS